MSKHNKQLLLRLGRNGAKLPVTMAMSNKEGIPCTDKSLEVAM
jgi:hypothetical protein